MAEAKIIGIIPARFGSMRFPGKMLADILGKSLIRRTYENARRASSLEEVIVATDDQRILTHVEGFGGKAVMTAADHPSGTDRVAEVVRKHYPHAEIVVNVQGDEPCLNPLIIDLLIDDLLKRPDAVMTTPVASITNSEDVRSPSIVKCVFTPSMRALYFSRSPIPFVQKGEGRHYRHLGVYCFRKDFLLCFSQMPKTSLQQTEDLEQLKILEQGYPIYVSIVQDDGIGVDTMEDLKRIEKKICKENTFLLQAE